MKQTDEEMVAGGESGRNSTGDRNQVIKKKMMKLKQIGWEVEVGPMRQLSREEWEETDDNSCIFKKKLHSYIFFHLFASLVVHT